MEANQDPPQALLTLERQIFMIVLMSLLGALAVSSMIGAVVITTRDGFRRVPTVTRY